MLRKRRSQPSLIALKIRGEQVDDIAAAANVMREKAQTISAPDLAMDIVGTGGDGFGIYNISIACAFVVAVVTWSPNTEIKPCRQKVGRPMFYHHLALNHCDIGLIKRALTDANITFLMAPRHHAAMRHVGPVRSSLE